MARTGTVLLLLPAALLAMTLAGCMQGAIDENTRQLAQQKAELDQLEQQVAALRAQQSSGGYASAVAPGGCDQSIAREATKRGAERFKARDFNAALGYYRDATTACPKDAQAQFNLAQAYEALGQRDQAVAHYRQASELAGAGTRSATEQQAREALARLGAR
jgi:tetratricopeptide (TPR) repeat protein